MAQFESRPARIVLTDPIDGCAAQSTATAAAFRDNVVLTLFTKDSKCNPGMSHLLLSSARFPCDWEQNYSICLHFTVSLSSPSLLHLGELVENIILASERAGGPHPRAVIFATAFTADDDILAYYYAAERARIPTLAVGRTFATQLIDAINRSDLPASITVHGTVDWSVLPAPLRNQLRTDDLAPFSSRGPTRDGRRKPDVVGPGMLVNSVNSDGILFSYNCNDAPERGYEALTVKQGTSMSTPLTAGAIATVRQYLREGFCPVEGTCPGRRDPALAFDPSAALLKALAINSAQPIGGIIVEYQSRQDKTLVAEHVAGQLSNQQVSNTTLEYTHICILSLPSQIRFNVPFVLFFS